MSIVMLAAVDMRYPRNLKLQNAFEALVSALSGVLSIYHVGSNEGSIGKCHAPVGIANVRDFCFLAENKDTADFGLYFEGASRLMLPDGKFKMVYLPFDISVRSYPTKGRRKGYFQAYVSLYSKHFMPVWKDGTDNYAAAKHNMGLLATLFERIKSKFGAWDTAEIEQEVGFCRGGSTVDELLDIDKLRDFELEVIQRNNTEQGATYNEFWYKKIERMYAEHVASKDLFYEKNDAQAGQCYAVLRKGRKYPPELYAWLKKRRVKVIPP